ncbi:HNH endonuclease [Rhizobium laguerreae]|uniref:HNH nuclease domain-containing protein n=1 Tax=Rhizobium laguerreae TaxID=1076926 RepID=A0A7Y2W8Q8_9HYPH|nr:HNH endonuclease [Rhizobium laguerreae]NNH67775.1 hypothetical protein [Rhizobium laguerreae]
MMMIQIVWKYGEAFTDGKIVRFFVGTKTYGELWATVDFADWPLICHLRWRATKRRSNLFYVRNSKGGDKLLHRVLTNAVDDLVVDHKDGDGLNNRRKNIRECTQADNVIFGADRRRGFVRRIIREQVETKPHVVRVPLADGSMKEYVYPTRAKSRTKTVVIVKDEKPGKTVGFGQENSI